MKTATRRIMRALEERELLPLARQIASKHHVSMDELLGRTRGKPEAIARRELWARAYEFVPSLTRLGKLFDRDHASISASIHKFESAQHRPPVTVPDLLPLEDSDPVACSQPPVRPVADESVASSVFPRTWLIAAGNLANNAREAQP